MRKTKQRRSEEDRTQDRKSNAKNDEKITEDREIKREQSQPGEIGKGGNERG